MFNIIFNSGLIGFLIWLLIFAVSTMGLAIAIRCAWSLRTSLFVSADFFEMILPLLKSRNWQVAFDYCDKHNSSLSMKIVKEILLTVHRRDVPDLQEMISEMLDRQVKMILRQINMLAMCGNIAPMLGLLGTVTGMVDAFMGLGTAMGPEKASVLAIAISQALYTTAAGLLAAIPAIACTVFFRNILEKRIELVTDLLDEAMKYIQEPEPQTFSNTETRKL